MSQNFIYSELVQSDDDLVGLVAYGIYKRHKIEFIEKFKRENNRPPYDSECKAFFASSTAPSQLSKYRNEAEDLLVDMVMNSTKEELERARQEIQADYQRNLKAVLPSNIKTVLLSLAGTVVFSIILGISALLLATSEKSTQELSNQIVEQVVIRLNNSDNDSTTVRATNSR